MAERDDAGIAEDQIERQSKQGGDGDLARQDQIIGEQREGQKRRQPKTISTGRQRVREAK